MWTCFPNTEEFLKPVELGNYFPDLKRLVVYYIELLFLKAFAPFYFGSRPQHFIFTDLARSTADLESFFLFINY